MIYSPINNYGSRGTATVQPAHYQHAIIYTGTVEPEHLKEEVPFSKQAIRMDPASVSDTLVETSRLNFGRPTPVDHTCAVRHIGDINPAYIEQMLYYFVRENGKIPTGTTPMKVASKHTRKRSEGHLSERLPKRVPESNDKFKAEEGERGRKWPDSIT
jgi:hypothetical protein